MDQESVRNLNRLLRRAVRAGDREAILALLEQGAEVDAPNAVGITTLMTAVEEGNREIVLLLLERGANVRAAVYDKPGSRLPTEPPPGDSVIKCVHTIGMIDLLVRHGARIVPLIPAQSLRRRVSPEEARDAVKTWCTDGEPAADEEIWEFCIVYEDAEINYGSRYEGYALVRQGIPVLSYLTKMGHRN